MSGPNSEEVQRTATAQANKRRYQSQEHVRQMDAPHDGGDQGVDHSAHDSLQEENHVEHVAPRAWRKPNYLGEIRDHPTFAFRWVSIDWRTRGDGEGLVRAIDEQWQPVMKGELKGYVLPSIAIPDLGAVVGKGRIVLCKMHKETKRQRDAYYSGLKDRMTNSVKENLKRINDRRMPISAVNKTQVTFRQRRVQAAVDEGAEGFTD